MFVSYLEGMKSCNYYIRKMYYMSMDNKGKYIEMASLKISKIKVDLLEKCNHERVNKEDISDMVTQEKLKRAV